MQERWRGQSTSLSGRNRPTRISTISAMCVWFEYTYREAYRCFKNCNIGGEKTNLNLFSHLYHYLVYSQISEICLKVVAICKIGHTRVKLLFPDVQQTVSCTIDTILTGKYSGVYSTFMVVNPNISMAVSWTIVPMKLYTSFFHSWPVYLFRTCISLWLSPSLLLDSVSSYSKSSRVSYCLSWMHLCCLFLLFSFSHRAWNYVPVRGMISTVNDPHPIH